MLLWPTKDSPFAGMGDVSVDKDVDVMNVGAFERKLTDDDSMKR